jgi:tRNA(Arg) A34 adenosine deaminase TadA
VTDEDWMRRAFKLGRRNPEAPFGTVITLGDQLVAEGLNHTYTNPIWHGEMDALIHVPPNSPWQDLTLYTTAEPCPMCCSAIIWAGVGRVVYSVSVPTLVELGWHQFDLRAEEISRRSHHPVEIRGGLLETEGRPLFVRRG